MQHIQFEREQEVTAANENAALPNLNCGGIKLIYKTLTLKVCQGQHTKLKKLVDLLNSAYNSSFPVKVFFRKFCIRPIEVLYDAV